MDYFKIEREVFKWLNRARTSPGSMVPYLREMLPHLKEGIYTNPYDKTRVELREVGCADAGQ